ncbi:cytochrome b/b6 domain-containing protein [Shewanella sp. Isolate7]|uniref:cytochrome b/b6 domain-containing protein n=1 Tax=Shewanella sp. Isolate7 TaxID=2908528 RepID=UPI001EFCF158|nr:cytochrome b/b6 domain-containing protein [Shewanella sp. Isolate7]MCG9721223.1 cytochrome b/b6 domain-containing protein [Shewanella sp. Isolate7]
MAHENTREIPVWDLFIRLFHWSLVLLFTLIYLTEGEDEWILIHSYGGYIILGILMLRSLWGLVGTRHARFSCFVRPPAEALEYLKQLFAGRAKDYLGHNPAGGLMIVALIVCVSLTAVTGMSLYATTGHGPLAGSFIAAWPEGALEEVHEFFANFSLTLVVVHIVGVIVGSLAHRENLMRAMWTGKKRRPLP